ncbi:MAG: respiratory chain complex I subunit 1 family protein [Actinomycetota bacterium]
MAALAFVHLALLAALAPALSGVIKTAKARLQGRGGPPPLQPYFDLWKLLRKDTIVPAPASIVFRAAPGVYASTVAAAALIVPFLWLPAPLAPWADALVLVGLFALGRFALALAGLDTGSSFGGMGSSREVAVASLVEPALLLAIFAVGVASGGTDVSATSAWLLDDPARSISIGQLLAFAALAVVVVAETGRVPVDNPDTHLELTMIHEGMVLEYAGRDLGIIQWATQLKQITLIALLIAIFVPAGIGAVLPIAILAVGAKLGVAAIALALIESTNAKLRILRLPELLGATAALAALAVAAAVVIR